MHRIRSLRPLTWVIVVVQIFFLILLATAVRYMVSNDGEAGVAAAIAILGWITPAWIFITYVLMVNWRRRLPLRCPGCRQPLTGNSPSCTSCGMWFMHADQQVWSRLGESNP